MKLTFMTTWADDTDIPWKKECRERINSVIETHNDLQRIALAAHLRGESDPRCVELAVRALTAIEEAMVLFADEVYSTYLKDVIRMRELMIAWLKESATDGASIARDEAQRLLKALDTLEVAIE